MSREANGVLHAVRNRLSQGLLESFAIVAFLCSTAHDETEHHAGTRRSNDTLTHEILRAPGGVPY